MSDELDKAADIISTMFSLSVIEALRQVPQRTHLYVWERDALEWLRRYRANDGDGPISHWTASYMRDGPPPWHPPNDKGPPG
jgi:hypothetical protein